LLRVYNQAWDYLPTGRFRGWIYRIAHNLLVDNIRRQSHDALVHAYTGNHDGGVEAVSRIAAHFVPPEDVAHQRELARIVDELLKELPDEQRLTFTMHYFSGLPLSEVAVAMETSLRPARAGYAWAAKSFAKSCEPAALAMIVSRVPRRLIVCRLIPSRPTAGHAV